MWARGKEPGLWSQSFIQTGPAVASPVTLDWYVGALGLCDKDTHWGGQL